LIPNGTDKMGSVNGNVTLNVEGQSVTFVYVDSTQRLGYLQMDAKASDERGTSFILLQLQGELLLLVVTIKFTHLHHQEHFVYQY
jgi:hypothetical protein